MTMTMSNWDFTPEELRTAARVAQACGGLVLPAAAAAWEKRAEMLEVRDYVAKLHAEPFG